MALQPRHKEPRPSGGVYLYTTKYKVGIPGALRKFRLLLYWIASGQALAMTRHPDDFAPVRPFASPHPIHALTRQSIAASLKPAQHSCTMCNPLQFLLMPAL